MPGNITGGGIELESKKRVLRSSDRCYDAVTVLITLRVMHWEHHGSINVYVNHIHSNLKPFQQIKHLYTHSCVKHVVSPKQPGRKTVLCENMLACKYTQVALTRQ